jgi:hypothetical protein
MAPGVVELFHGIVYNLTYEDQDGQMSFLLTDSEVDIKLAVN